MDKAAIHGKKQLIDFSSPTLKKVLQPKEKCGFLMGSVVENSKNNSIKTEQNDNNDVSAPPFPDFLLNTKTNSKNNTTQLKPVNNTNSINSQINNNEKSSQLEQNIDDDKALIKVISQYFIIFIYSNFYKLHCTRKTRYCQE